MAETYRIEYVEKPQDSAWGIIGRGLGAYNKEMAGDDSSQLLCFAIFDSNDEIVGGVLGVVHWEWFNLDLLWIREELRGQGYGTRLLNKAEDQAREYGAKHVYLDTFSFQAPEF